MAQTLVVNIDHIERIDRMIMTAEARRNAVLREINRHRAVLGEKRRRVTHDVEDANFEEVDTPQQVENGTGVRGVA